jgi:hypothetical protein
MNTIEGIVAFSNVTEHEEYNGKTTEKYSLTVTLDDDVADELAYQRCKNQRVPTRRQGIQAT